MPSRFRDLFRAGKGSGAKPSAGVARQPTAPEQPAGPYSQALALHQQGKLEQAIALYDQALSQGPARAEIHYKRANALNGLGRAEAAIAGYDDAIALDPGYANAYCNRGVVFERLGRWEEALASYDRALSLNPADYLGHYNRASMLRQLGRIPEALADYERALALKSDYAEAHVNRGHLLLALGRGAEAVASYDQAIAVGFKSAEVYALRGSALATLHRTPEALDSFERAIACDPAHVGALVDRGNALVEVRRVEEAVASYDRALQLNPDSAVALRNRGGALLELNRIAEAVESYERALALEPQMRNLLGLTRDARMQICDWRGYDADRELIRAGLEAGRPVCLPLAVAALFDEPHLHRLAASAWVSQDCPPDDSLGPLPRHRRAGRIRVGYFSADLRVHPVALLTAGLFETHDRARFEVTAFAFGPVSAADPVRERLERAFEHFVYINNRSDPQAALLSRESGLDIAIDLGGFTERARTRIFALRAAPVQISYLGYPGTSAAPYMDYLVADHTLIPPGSEQHYSEKIIYLPDSYQPNDSKREIAAREFTRSELGLPEGVVVFCCFNRYFKLSPYTFDSWMRILGAVPGSVLWLTAADKAVVGNLRAAAAARGIEPQRLVFAPRMPSMADHLARQRAADLFLDTLPFNAHTTASDALAAGLPVITCAGHTLAGRVAASLLNAVGLPELITGTPQQYEALTIRLATQPRELQQLRQKLRARLASAPLFDTQRYTRAFERALSEVYERSQSGLSPEHVVVP
jgi:predicted O-linked N-acetylglucosamine transferase (SPINDLY family)